MARRRNAARREKTRRSERAINGSGHWSLEHGSSSPKAGFRRHAGIRRSGTRGTVESTPDLRRVHAAGPAFRARPTIARKSRQKPGRFTRVPRVSAGHFQVAGRTRRSAQPGTRRAGRRRVRVDPAARSAAESSARLHQYSCLDGAALIVETLHAQRLGGVREVPQPSDGVTYAEKINKAEALIDWQQDAVLISRRVRAFNPWPIDETRLNGTQLRIWEARPLDSAGMEAAETGAGTLPGTVLAATHEGIDVACGRGVLRILRLQLAGRRPLFAQEFIKGQRLDGVRFAPVRPA